MRDREHEPEWGSRWDRAAPEECGCCEVNDYDPAPEEHEVPGSCLNCGHSPEEHEPDASYGGYLRPWDQDTSVPLDPRWDWCDVRAIGDPGPVWIKAGCKHVDTVDVESCVNPSVVLARLCLTCDRQLPAQREPDYGIWMEMESIR